MGGKIIYNYKTFNMLTVAGLTEAKFAELAGNENIIQMASDMVRLIPPNEIDKSQMGAQEVATGGTWWYDRIDAEEVLRTNINKALRPLSKANEGNRTANAKLPLVIGGLGFLGLIGASLAGKRGMRNLFLILLGVSLAVFATGCGAAFWTTTATGAGVNVAIIDTGIDNTNPDLADNVKGGATFLNGLAAYVAAVYGGNLQSDCGWATPPSAQSPFNDEMGHGSMVAGFIAAENNHQGIIGVAPQANLYIARVFGCGAYGFSLTSDIIAALDWARTNGMDIVNISLGGIPLPRECDPEEYADATGCASFLDPIFGPGAGAASYADSAAWIAAIDAAVTSGVTVVVAAGNDHVDLGKPSSYCSWDVYRDGSLVFDWLAMGSAGCFEDPSSYTKVIAVGATSWNDVISSFSNYGADVEIFAPGSREMSTCSTVAYWTGSPFWKYCNGSGTSFASPITAGVAATLHQGACPYSAATPAGIRARLQATAEHAIYFDAGVTPIPQGLVDDENACLGTTNGDNWKNN